MNVTEKTSYLKGLLEGLQIDESKPENKLLKAIIEAVDEIAQEVSELSKSTGEIEDYLDEIDYDLGALEEDFYDDDDFDDFDIDDDADIEECCCDCDAANETVD